MFSPRSTGLTSLAMQIAAKQLKQGRTDYPLAKPLPMKKPDCVANCRSSKKSMVDVNLLREEEVPFKNEV